MHVIVASVAMQWHNFRGSGGVLCCLLWCWLWRRIPTIHMHSWL